MPALLPPPRRRPSPLVVFCVLCLLCAAALPPPARAAEPGAPPVAPCAGEADAPRWTERLNALRLQSAPTCGPAGHGAALRWSPRLAASAAAQAVDLARRSTLSHHDGSGRELSERLRSAGYRPTRAAENLALGSADFEATLALWQASRAHCENLMEPGFTDVAVACAERRDEPDSRVWVLQLGRPLPPP